MSYADDHSAYIPAQESNALGLAGFICSILGLFTGTLLSPVGLILSLIALGRRPRGFAIAGVIIGLLGTCGGLILIVLAVVFGLSVLAGLVGLFFTQSERIELTTDMAKIAAIVEEYRDENRGIPPVDLPTGALDTSTLTDPWGNRYRYVLSEGEPGYDIISDGEDGKPGTADDVSLSRLDQYWEGAMEDFKERLEAFENRASRRDSEADHDVAPETPPAAPVEPDSSTTPVEPPSTP